MPGVGHFDAIASQDVETVKAFLQDNPETLNQVSCFVRETFMSMWPFIGRSFSFFLSEGGTESLLEGTF